MLASAEAQAQRTIRGTVTDAATGEPLPAANVQVEGTYRGTITNREGVYALRLDELPATLVVRFIGFESARRTVTSETPGDVDIALQPTTYRMDEIVVTDENPAERIMREVIERKQQWREALDTYRAEAYNRFTIANDTGIVSILETLTEAYWDDEEGLREVMKGRRQTSNMNVPDALPAALFVANLYDDNVDVAGHNLIGVTHPEALRHYDFTLDGTRRRDDQVVYDIRVEPANRLKSGFVGRVAVLDSAYALLEVALRPAETVRFPPPIQAFDVTYEQQFSNFGGDFWLPVDFRSELTMELRLSRLLQFPPFRVQQVSRFTEYDVNVALPDSLFAEDEAVTVDSLALRSDSLIQRPGAGVPLSLPEQQAYDTIDSTMTMQQAFEPDGLLARLINLSGSSDSEGASVSASTGEGDRADVNFDVDPVLWYNRVDALHGGLEASVDVGRLQLRGQGGYSTGPEGDEAWSYGGGVGVQVGPERQGFIGVDYAVENVPRVPSQRYGRLVNSAYTLLGGEDYFDYYRREGVTARAGYQVDPLDTSVHLAYHDAEHTSLDRSTSYDLVGAEPLRINPPIRDGRMRSVSASVRFGDAFNPLQVFGQRRAEVAVEHSSEALSSDYDFTTYRFNADWRIETFFQRRLLPNVLDVRVMAGTSTGDVPLQRLGLVDASMGVYSPFGVLKTLRGRPYQGDEHVGLFWEHNFRTVPFEALGLDVLAERSWNLIVFGGHARTWADLPEGSPTVDVAVPVIVPEQWHHEVGVSLSGLGGIFRVDVATRLDAPAWTVGLGAARVF
jgi:hypothetical protein